MAKAKKVLKFRGKPACACLIKWLPEFEKELLRRGLIKKSIDIYQLIGGAPKSGGTHLNGGCFDIAQRSDAVIAVAQEMGAVLFNRKYNWDGKGGMAHGHGVLIGCPHNYNAAYQITARQKGYNGLGSGGRGGRWDGPKAPSEWRDWEEGIDWARAQRRSRPVAGKPIPRTRYVVAHPDGVDARSGPGKTFRVTRHYPKGYVFTADRKTGFYHRHAKPLEWLQSSRLDRAKKGQ